MNKLELEEIYASEKVANDRADELRKEYTIVKVFPIKYGGRRKYDYHYVVRAYDKIHS